MKLLKTTKTLNDNIQWTPKAFQVNYKIINHHPSMCLNEGGVTKCNTFVLLKILIILHYLSYSPLLLFTWGASQIQIFVSQWANSIGPSLKINKLRRLLKVEGSIFNYRVPPLWPTYIGERRTKFAKSYGIKVRCYGEHVGEQIGNLMRTHLVLIGNIVGTQWEPEKNEKKNSSPRPHPKLKWKKKQGNVSACLGLLIGCMKFLFPKEFFTIFGLGEYPLQRTPFLLWKAHPNYVVWQLCGRLFWLFDGAIHSN